VAVWVGVGEAVLVAVGVFVSVGVKVAVGVGLMVGVAVRVGVFVNDGVFDGSWVILGWRVDVGLPEEGSSLESEQARLRLPTIRKATRYKARGFRIIVLGVGL
jgi:hypothetical protein